MRCVSVCACMHMCVSSESPGSYKCSHSLSLPSFPSLAAPGGGGGGWKAAGIAHTIAAVVCRCQSPVAAETPRSAGGAAFKPERKQTHGRVKNAEKKAATHRHFCGNTQMLMDTPVRSSAGTRGHNWGPRKAPRDPLGVTEPTHPATRRLRTCSFS